MKYRFKDVSGAVFEGRTYAQVVSQMRQSSWQAPGKHPYMEGVARRVFALDNGRTTVPTATAVEFIKSLEQHKWLQRMT